MNKQQMIDKAIEELKGNLPSGGDANYLISPTPSHTHWGEGKYQMYSGAEPIGPYWQYICTRKEFIDRVEELNNMKKWNGEGLPPVGTELLWLSPNTGVYHHTRIIHINDESVWLEGEGVVSHDVNRYKPIQSERDKAVELAIKSVKEVDARFQTTFLEALYDAGMLKLPKKSGDL